MQDDSLSVTQTWPLSRLNMASTARTAKASSSQCLFDVLQNARDYVEKTSDLTDLPTQHTRSLIQALCYELEKRTAMSRQKSITSAQARFKNSPIKYVIF
jgi:hypothetical protein